MTEIISETVSAPSSPSRTPPGVVPTSPGVLSPSSGMWNILKDKVNKNGIMRRISMKRISKIPVLNRSKIGTEFNEVEETVCSLVFSAQIFTFSSSGDEGQWERISDDIIQVVLICEEETPKPVFRVTTFDPDLQGFIHSYIVIPDTKINRESSTFIHWKDHEEGTIWGIHFMNTEDQQKFLEICVPKEDQPLQKSNSSEALTSLGTPAEHLLQYETSTVKRKPKKMVQSAENSQNVDTSLLSPDHKTSPSGVKKKLSKKQQMNLKYATYSGKHREKLRKAGYFDSIEKENLKDDTSGKEEGQKSNEDGLRSPSVTSDSTGVSGTDKESSRSGESSDCVFTTNDKGTPKKTISLNACVEPGVLKSAKFVQDNASNFTSANTFQRQSTLPDSLEDSGTLKSKHKTESQSFFGRGHKNKNKGKKVKRSTSFSEKALRSSKGKDNLEQTQRFLEETNTMLQEYEVHLHRQTLHETIDSGFYGNSVETSEGVPYMNSKWDKRASAGFGSESDCSFGFHTDTLTESSVGDRDSRVDSDFHENIFNEDEDEDLGDEDEESNSLSSHHTQASMFQQRGAIRKAGWLEVKSMLVQRKKRVERAGKRSWKKYWVCLKGTMLLFHACPDKTTTDENGEPRHILVVENGLAQAVPEHPKRENIFCLSTGFGDAYLLQAPTQIDLENWVIAIHSACSSAFARQHGKEDTLRLLRDESQKLDAQIEMESKTKKMAELQLSTVTEPKNRQAIITQITQWEHNLEKFQLELYRLRCYMSSLQATELPNPKTLLANVSRNTKVTLSRLGYFSVSSFHALVCARNPMGLEGRFSKPKTKKQPKTLFGTLKKKKVPTATLR